MITPNSAVPTRQAMSSDRTLPPIDAPSQAQRLSSVSSPTPPARLTERQRQRDRAAVGARPLDLAGQSPRRSGGCSRARSRSRRSSIAVSSRSSATSSLERMPARRRSRTARATAAARTHRAGSDANEDYEQSQGRTLVIARGGRGYVNRKRRGRPSRACGGWRLRTDRRPQSRAALAAGRCPSATRSAHRTPGRRRSRPRRSPGQWARQRRLVAGHEPAAPAAAHAEPAAIPQLPVPVMPHARFLHIRQTGDRAAHTQRGLDPSRLCGILR